MSRNWQIMLGGLASASALIVGAVLAGMPYNVYGGDLATHSLAGGMPYNVYGGGLATHSLAGMPYNIDGGDPATPDGMPYN
jgi:hypothetical protein